MPSQVVSKAHLSVEDGRPLAKAIELLESRYGWVITYDDPRYIHNSEIADVTLRVRRDLDKYKPGEAPKVLVPKGGALTFDYDVRSDTNQPSGRRAVVQELLATYNRSGLAGRFRLEKNGPILHVIPMAIKNSHGQLMPQESILETRISLTAKERTGMEKLERICSATSQATKIRVGIGIVPENWLSRHRDSKGATRQRARDVLVSLLESLGNSAKWSWQLFYDPSPGLQVYVLNIHPVIKHE